MPNRIAAIIPPVLLNAFIVSIWVSRMYNVSYLPGILTPYWSTVLTIGLGEFFAVAGLGTLLLILIERIKDYR
jgi:hypothetical protein